MPRAQKHGRFGSGHAVRRGRRCEPSERRRTFCRRCAVATAPRLFPALAACACADRDARHQGAAAMRRHGGGDRRRSRARRQALPKFRGFQARDGAPLRRPPGMAWRERVRFVGEAVALVVAQTRAQAQDAVEAIEVRYEAVTGDRGRARGNRGGCVARVAGGRGQHRGRGAHGDASATAAAFRDAAACRHAGSRQSARRAVSDRAARGAGVATMRPPSISRCTSAPRPPAASAIRSATKCSTFRTTRCGCSSATWGGLRHETASIPRTSRSRVCARALERRSNGAPTHRRVLAATHGRDLHSKAELALDPGRPCSRVARSVARQPGRVRDAGRVVIQLLIGPWSRHRSTTSRRSTSGSRVC